jgi:hypothetical protein
MSLKRRIKTRILEVCVEAKMNLRTFPSITDSVKDEKGDLVADSHNCRM